MTDHLIPPALLYQLEMSEEKVCISEEEFIQALTEKVAYFLEYRLDYFLSLLYRLDILEVDIKRALIGNLNPAEAFARLIIERQKQRLRTKARYSQNCQDWEE